MFVTSIIFFIAAIVATVIYFVRRPKPEPKTTDENRYDNSSSRTKSKPIGHKIALGAAGLFYALTVLFLVFSISVTTGTKKVSVITEYGKPIDTRPNGLSAKAPWQKKTELDAAMQTDVYGGEGHAKCTTVRIGNQSNACAHNSIRWRIIGEKADELFRDHKEFDNIRENLVTLQYEAVLNGIFKTYDPLSTLKEAAAGRSPTAPVVKPPTNEELGKLATKMMQAKIGGQIEVLEVLVTFVDFDASTQGKIEAYQAEIANTRIAQQRQQTALAEAEANRKLAASVSKDPNVLVSKCLDTINQMVKDKQALPAGFSCWPGGGSAIVMPSATTPK